MLMFLSDEYGMWFYVVCEYCGWNFWIVASEYFNCPRCGAEFNLGIGVSWRGR